MMAIFRVVSSLNEKIWIVSVSAAIYSQKRSQLAFTIVSSSAILTAVRVQVPTIASRISSGERISMIVVICESHWGQSMLCTSIFNFEARLRGFLAIVPPVITRNKINWCLPSRK